MIKEYEYLHGVVFSRLCSNDKLDITIKSFNSQGHSSYSINNKAGLYIKYCGNRLSPWSFTFTSPHLDEIEGLRQDYGEVFIALVCNLDGIVVLNYNEFIKIIEDSIYVIRVSRVRNKMYSIFHKPSKTEFKISKTSCPDKIFEFLLNP